MIRYDNKWVRKIADLQQEDGSCGCFHTLSKPTKEQPVSIEQALRRLRALGLTRGDEPIDRALQYMCECLSGKRRPPDHREKVLNWDAFESHMLAAWMVIPLSLNRYAYVLNNPISFFDPSGLITEVQAKAEATKKANEVYEQYCRYDSYEAEMKGQAAYDKHMADYYAVQTKNNFIPNLKDRLPTQSSIAANKKAQDAVFSAALAAKTGDEGLAASAIAGMQDNYQHLSAGERSVIDYARKFYQDDLTGLTSKQMLSICTAVTLESMAEQGRNAATMFTTSETMSIMIRTLYGATESKVTREAIQANSSLSNLIYRTDMQCIPFITNAFVDTELYQILSGLKKENGELFKSVLDTTSPFYAALTGGNSRSYGNPTGEIS